MSEFAPEENCVEYVMKQLQAVYPPVYQDWADKHSDRALARFCLYGLAAHRIETEVVDGRKLYVVRTNMLSGLPVREGFERYGGDAYFDESWKPVMIVDYGMGPMREDDDASKVVTKPGEQNWARAKFRFRSSLFVLVTLVDHLYHVHLQTTNLFVTALREQLSPEHPIRRFLTPFTYQTISINDNAKFNLVAPRSMGPRCFALTDRGLELAFTGAPDLVVPPTKDIFDLRAYILKLKESGVDTVYWQQALELYDIMERFVVGYLWCYYASMPTCTLVTLVLAVLLFLAFVTTSMEICLRKQDLADDLELRRFARHFFHCLEVIDAGSSRRVGAPRISCVSPAASAEDTWDFYIKWMAGVMWLVTAGHEQMGAVEAQRISLRSLCVATWHPLVSELWRSSHGHIARQSYNVMKRQHVEPAGRILDGVQVVARGTEGNEANGDVAGSAHVLYVYTHAKASGRGLVPPVSFGVDSLGWEYEGVLQKVSE
eukprot:s641_g4.t1